MVTHIFYYCEHRHLYSTKVESKEVDSQLSFMSFVFHKFRKHGSVVYSWAICITHGHDKGIHHSVFSL